MEIKNLKSKKSIQELLEFGILNIDKCSGPTSFGVSEFVCKSLGLRKTSHFGTLDPKVTGVLPIALNRACKLTGYFLGHDKEYVGVMRIHEDIELGNIEEMIKKKFLGKILQTPPVKSRVKRQEREREIKKFDLLEKDGQNILFQVVCQGGTYIRKLIDDLGRELGIGAHMLELRRVRAGIFDEDTTPQAYTQGAREPFQGPEKSSEKISTGGIVNLYDFEKAVESYKKGDEKLLRKMITPAEIVSEFYDVVQVKEEEVERLLTGKPIYKNDLVGKSNAKVGEIIIVFCEDKFIGIYKVVNEGEKFAKGEFVMQGIGG